MSIDSPYTTERERGAYSVTAYKEGDTYVGEDNVGTVQKEGTSAAVVLQATLDTLPTEGGKLFLSRDVFELDTGLTVTQKAVTIEGCNRGVRFYDYGTMLKATADSIDILTMSDRGARVTNLCISGAGRTGTNGLKLSNDSLAEQLVIKDCLGIGMLFNGNGGRISDSMIAGCKTGVETGIEDCWVSGCDISYDDAYEVDYGIKVKHGGTRISDSTHIWGCEEACITITENCVISDSCMDDYAKKGIVMDTTAGGINWVTLDHLMFVIKNQAAANTYDAIEVAGSNSAWDARVTNCTFYSASGNTPRYCINGSMPRLICTENNFHSSAFSTSALNLSGSGRIEANNIGV
jgi:hypothetical protein